jgi:8-oxo-dGTP pyrophosphatase MutT (NUDIX family)
MTAVVSKTASMYAFKIDADRAYYLLLRRAAGRKLAGAWQAVHGHIEKDETAAEAAVRELREETELVPSGVWAIDYVERVYDPRKDEVRLVPCFAALVTGEVKLSAEHDASRWLSRGEASNLFTFENQRAALEIADRDIGKVVARGGDPSPFLRIVQ